MENNNTTSTQLTENLYLRTIKKGENTYHFLRNYYEYEEDGKKLQGKKDVFVTEQMANELLILLYK